VSVNASPSRAAQRSITQVGASAHASVCTTAGARGPGGGPDRAAPGVRSRAAAELETLDGAVAIRTS
jgi:hypothetical protein